MAGQATTVPGGDRDSLEFTQERLTAWSDNAALLNLTPEDVIALEASTDAAAAALANQALKAEQSKLATVAWHAAAAANRTLARDLVRKIRYAAGQAADPTPIYVAAMIPPPKDREDLPKPPVPTNLRVTLDTQGRAVLRFDASRYGSTIFTVERQTVPVAGQPGPWTHAATIQDRELTDNATPAGVAGVNYRVRAERPVGAGAFSSPVGLPLGSGGNQQFVAPSDQAVAGAIAPAKASGKDAG